MTLKKDLEIDKYRKKLLEMRVDLEKEIRRSESTNDQRDGFHVNVADEDFDEQGGDAASETVERSRIMAIVGNLRDMMDSVNEALGKIDAGTYGKCDVCGKAIPKKRLDALPHATMCTDCRSRVLGR
ncbi:MAG TPA: TraR/DksA C4-type zinc finger protein [Armatimonadota bacterium]